MTPAKNDGLNWLKRSDALNGGEAYRHACHVVVYLRERVQITPPPALQELEGSQEAVASYLEDVGVRI